MAHRELTPDQREEARQKLDMHKIDQIIQTINELEAEGQ